MDRKIVTGRELTGMAMLVILLLAGLMLSRHLQRQHEVIAATLEDSAWMALSGQWSDAREQAEGARQQWKQDWDHRAIFADHTPIGEIDDLFEELRVLAAAGERTEFARNCTALASRIRAMGDAQRLTWQNVL